MHSSLLLALLVLAVSCASPRRMTTNERQALAQKEYSHLSREELIDAAKQVFVLMDKKDVEFQTTENGFVASRDWFMYRVVHASCGTDFWKFEVKEENGKLVASIRPSVRYGLVESEEKGALVQGSAIYDMFWSRLDYLVGQSNKWPTCEEALKKSQSNQTWGSLEQICDSITLSDELPPTQTPYRSIATTTK